jgi:S1-C subfamily serine protease
MDWEKYVVQINVKSKVINLNYPLNIFKTTNSSGTGFFISPTEILTCHHVVYGAINIDITFKHTNSIKGHIKHIFPDDDLAIIVIDPIFISNDIGILDHETSSIVQSGKVFTVGFPLSSTNIKITKGIISGYQKSLIQTDASLNHGNSGGPLVILDYKTQKYKVIGVNVSKLKGDAEKTGYAVPIYRFQILRNKLNNNSDLIIRKPLLFFDFQPLIEHTLKSNLLQNKKKEGVRITLTNKNYYHSAYLKENDILLKINDKVIDYNGFIKFDFYPEKIPIDDIGLWYTIGDTITLEILNIKTREKTTKTFNLEFPKSNLFEFYNLDNTNTLLDTYAKHETNTLLDTYAKHETNTLLDTYAKHETNTLLDTYAKHETNTNNDNQLKKYPDYFVEKNGLILSIISSVHLENLKTLNLSMAQIVKIWERRLYHKDLFTVYLADTKYTDTAIDNNTKYPIGEIIIEINDKTFTRYDELIAIINSIDKITSIKTIDNNYYII